jgi:hypothetical protein
LAPEADFLHPFGDPRDWDGTQQPAAGQQGDEKRNGGAASSGSSVASSGSESTGGAASDTGDGAGSSSSDDDEDDSGAGFCPREYPPLRRAQRLSFCMPVILPDISTSAGRQVSLK